MCRAMNKAKQLIDRLEAQHSLSIEEYEYLIENQSDELAAYAAGKAVALRKQVRSEEHTSELQSPTHISYAVFCLKKKK